MAWEVPNFNLQGQPGISPNWSAGIMQTIDDNRAQKKASDILLARKAAQAQAVGPDGKFNSQNAAQYLLGAGDMQGAQVYSGMAENEADRAWRREEAERAQRNADRSFGLQAQSAARERQPNIQEIYENGLPQKVIVNPDGSYAPLGTTKAPRTAAGLTNTDKKAILEADEGIMAGNNVVQALSRAKDINQSAYHGLGADSISYMESNLPDWMVPDWVTGGSKKQAIETQELSNLVTSQALDQLRATFGSMPTEGERKILLEIQGSVGQAPEVRQKIFDRAIDLANKRLEFNKRQARGLRDGSYYTDEGGNVMQEAGTAPMTQPQQPPAQPQSAPRAFNPQTGQTIELRNGQWVPVQ